MPSEAFELIAASRFAGIVAPAGQPGTEASGTQKVVAEAPAGSASAASAITPASSRPLPLRTRMLSPTYRLGIVPQNLGSLGMRRFATLLAAIALALALASPAAADAAPKLRAGAGQADIQPPQTGYYLGGYTRADRLALGQHTRLFAKTILLERGGERIALVSLDLFMIPAGMQQQIARLAGLEPENVLILPTHTHSGPGGYANFPTYNTAAPSPETIQNPTSFVELIDPKPADRQLYTFLLTQITKSIRRAARDLGPAVAGWGSGRIVGLTRNRSLEAHLADHGTIEARGEGTVEQDPEGVVHTIDPNVDVLRVDKVIGGRRVPIGGFSSFPNHGTVVKAPFQAYNGDHHATAHRVFEQRVRRAGDVPNGQL